MEKEEIANDFNGNVGVLVIEQREKGGHRVELDEIRIEFGSGGDCVESDQFSMQTDFRFHESFHFQIYSSKKKENKRKWKIFRNGKKNGRRRRGIMKLFVFFFFFFFFVFFFCFFFFLFSKNIYI